MTVDVAELIPPHLRHLLKQAKQPDWTPPMLATLTEQRFSDPGWIYERKLDGVRLLGFVTRRGATLMTRNRLSANKQAEAMRESWKEVAEGEMPTWFYLALHPEARLSANDQSVLRAWSGSAAGGEEGENDDD